jgi:hypothetical protein
LEQGAFWKCRGDKISLLIEIQSIDLLEEDRPLTDEEIVKRALLKAHLEKVVLMQEVSRRQKSRTTWLKEGDQNMSFFHCLANSHRRNNFISSLSIDGSETSNQEVINDTIILYYKNLFIKTTLWRPRLDGLEFPLLDAGEVNWFERPFRGGSSSGVAQYGW